WDTEFLKVDGGAAGGIAAAAADEGGDAEEERHSGESGRPTQEAVDVPEWSGEEEELGRR
ncbi:hypothetical protein PFISCL1PPCAC_11758, partial [Pristionchus fissidentatus]